MLKVLPFFQFGSGACFPSLHLSLSSLAYAILHYDSDYFLFEPYDTTTSWRCWHWSSPGDPRHLALRPGLPGQRPLRFALDQYLRSICWTPSTLAAIWTSLAVLGELPEQGPRCSSWTSIWTSLAVLGDLPGQGLRSSSWPSTWTSCALQCLEIYLDQFLQKYDFKRNYIRNPTG